MLKPIAKLSMSNVVKCKLLAIKVSLWTGKMRTLIQWPAKFHSVQKEKLNFAEIAFPIFFLLGNPHYTQQHCMSSIIFFNVWCKWEKFNVHYSCTTFENEGLANYIRIIDGELKCNNNKNFL